MNGMRPYRVITKNRHAHEVESNATIDSYFSSSTYDDATKLQNMSHESSDDRWHAS